MLFRSSLAQAAATRISLLTERERQVLECLIAGKANKVIAYELDISPRTVEIHRAHVMEKMQARSLSDVVRMALVKRDGKNLSATFAGTVADRVTDVASLIVIAAVGLLFIPASHVGPEIRILGVPSLILCLGVGGAVITVQRISLRKFPPRIARVIVDLRQAFEAISKRKASAFVALLLSLQPSQPAAPCWCDQHGHVGVPHDAPHRALQPGLAE